MDNADYWLMAREYSIWNATIASLQLWTEDLDPVNLGRATECVYTTFLYSPSSHTFHQQSNEILFGCLVIALNAAFDQQPSLADKGYESGSDTIDLPTPLRKTPHIHHVSSMEHTSFDPAPTTPCSTSQTPPRPVCRHLSFSSAVSYTPDSTPECPESSEDGTGRLPDGTFRWWTLDFQRNTWKDIMCSWVWFTTWIMSITMPLHELSNALLHGQFGFKWHFRLWGLYGHIQWRRHTRNGGNAILIQDLGLIEHYLLS